MSDEVEMPDLDGAGTFGSVAGMSDLLQAIGAAASSYRAKLITDGWSIPMAEQVAASALLQWQTRLFSGGRG